MHQFFLLLLGLVRSTDKLPERPKARMLAWIAFLLLIGYLLHQLPAILHETPPNIRALREKPVQRSLPTDVDQHDQVAGVKWFNFLASG